MDLILSGSVPYPNQSLQFSNPLFQFSLESVHSGKTKFGIRQDDVVLVDEVSDNGLETSDLQHDRHEILVANFDHVSALDLSLAYNEDAAQEIPRPIFFARKNE